MKFAYDALGQSLVVCDSKEVLVHDGTTLAPLWRHKLNTRVVAVHSDGKHIQALTSDGELITWNALSGVVRASIRLNTQPQAMDANRDGLLAIAGLDRLLIHNAQDVVFDLNMQADALAWGDNGLLAVAENQSFTILCGTDTNPSAQVVVDLPAKATSVRWNSKGFWLLACGAELISIDTQGHMETLKTTADEEPIVDVAVSPQGDRVALQLNETMATAMRWPTQEPIGQVLYMDRSIKGLAFGPSNWLGIGLVGGDGNKVDLATGTTHRTQAHQGRDKQDWALSVATAASIQSSGVTGLVMLSAIVVLLVAAVVVL
jgi:hypothetical protein